METFETVLLTAAAFVLPLLVLSSVVMVWEMWREYRDRERIEAEHIAADYPAGPYPGGNSVEGS